MMFLAAIHWHSCFFFLFATIACVFALGVLFASNIVRMALYLIISLSATAALFMLAGAEFVGAMQIMIYVGGTLVLLIFGVMLTAQGSFVSLRTSSGQWVLSIAVGGAMLMVLVHAAWSVSDWRVPREDPAAVTAQQSQAATPLGMGLLGIRVDKLSETNTMRRNGMSGYLLPFEIVSIHLLVVLIGATYLARTKRRIRQSDL